MKIDFKIAPCLTPRPPLTNIIDFTLLALVLTGLYLVPPLFLLYVSLKISTLFLTDNVFNFNIASSLYAERGRQGLLIVMLDLWSASFVHGLKSTKCNSDPRTEGLHTNLYLCERRYSIFVFKYKLKSFWIFYFIYLSNYIIRSQRRGTYRFWIPCECENSIFFMSKVGKRADEASNYAQCRP